MWLGVTFTSRFHSLPSWFPLPRPTQNLKKTGKLHSDCCSKTDIHWRATTPPSQLLNAISAVQRMESLPAKIVAWLFFLNYLWHGSPLGLSKLSPNSTGFISSPTAKFIFYSDVLLMVMYYDL